jgi:hypothetical protein
MFARSQSRLLWPHRFRPSRPSPLVKASTAAAGGVSATPKRTSATVQRILLTEQGCSAKPVWPVEQEGGADKIFRPIAYQLFRSEMRLARANEVIADRAVGRCAEFLILI